MVVAAAKSGKESIEEEISDSDRQYMGLVMPISEIDGCSTEHWLDVKYILEDVAKQLGYDLLLVSSGGPVEVIHQRIVTNLVNYPIVICDLSALNPNVMLELGMRLAFDKPFVLIKDTSTKAPFDAGIIEYVEYPRSLHYPSMVDFRNKLSKKLELTIKKSTEDKNYSPFLRNFGAEAARKNVGTGELTNFEILRASLDEIKAELRVFRSPSVAQTPGADNKSPDGRARVLCFRDCSDELFDKFASKISEEGLPVRSISKRTQSNGRHSHIQFQSLPEETRRQILGRAQTIHANVRWLG